MDRILRTIAQYPIQLALLILLPIAIGGGVAYLLPRHYQATATLWALHSYEALTATSVDSANQATPAETQVTALMELLQTRSFSLRVAQETALAETLPASYQSDPQSRDSALAADIAQVQVQTQGYDLFSISYAASDPRITQQVVAAVIHEYGLQAQKSVVPQEQNLLATYQSELSQDQQNTQSAVAAQALYTESHPNLTQSQLQSDSHYQQLQAQAQLAQSNLQNLQTSIATLQQYVATHQSVAANLYEVVDAPLVPTQPVSRLKTLLLGAGTGLVIAILAAALFIALMMRRDRRVYTGKDLQKVTAFPIVMELPRLEHTVVAKLILKTYGHSGSRSRNGVS